MSWVEMCGGMCVGMLLDVFGAGPQQDGMTSDTGYTGQYMIYIRLYVSYIQAIYELYISDIQAI